MNKKIVSLVATAVMALSFVGTSVANAGILNNLNSGQVILNDSEITPFTTVYVGGGTWDYGTDIGVSGKKVWSYYDHSSKVHSATVRIGSSTNSSGWVSKGITARASLIGSLLNTAEAFWNTL